LIDLNSPPIASSSSVELYHPHTKNELIDLFGSINEGKSLEQKELLDDPFEKLFQETMNITSNPRYTSFKVNISRDMHFISNIFFFKTICILNI
jgi:hypothetical protein